MDKKIATITLNLEDSRPYREGLSVWLHRKADEIRTLEDGKYSKNPSWNFIVE